MSSLKSISISKLTFIIPFLLGVSFIYSKKIGQSYLELIESVQRIDNEKLNEKKSLALQKKQLDEDQELIDAVSKLIIAGITTKSSLVKCVWDETGVPQKKSAKFCKLKSGNFKENLQSKAKLCTGAVQRCNNLVDFEKC